MIANLMKRNAGSCLAFLGLAYGTLCDPTLANVRQSLKKFATFAHYAALSIVDDVAGEVFYGLAVDVAACHGVCVDCF